MHPIFAQRERFILYMAIWLVIAGLLCFLFVEMNALTWSEAAALILPMSFVYAFMCLASLYLCRSFPLQETPFLNVVGVVTVSSFLSAALWLAIGKGIATTLTRADSFPDLNAKYDSNIPLLLGIGMLLFVLGIVIHYLLLAFDSARSAERRALELQVLAREAELKALRSQIQPHFLFNSLNSISALTATDASAARAMSLRLAEFFRKTLKLGQQQFIPLAEEFQLAENFLSIEQVRFGSRLKFEKNVEDGCAEILVPSLILQPVVENAVNHGVAHLVEGGTILFSAERKGSSLHVSVSNPCDPERPQSKSTRVGLTNVRKRLNALYGNDAQCTVENNSENFTVQLMFPANSNTPIIHYSLASIQKHT